VGIIGNKQRCLAACQNQTPLFIYSLALALSLFLSLLTLYFASKCTLINIMLRETHTDRQSERGKARERQREREKVSCVILLVFQAVAEG
jgi:hypothetical protein